MVISVPLDDDEEVVVVEFPPLARTADAVVARFVARAVFFLAAPDSAENPRHKDNTKLETKTFLISILLYISLI